MMRPAGFLLLIREISTEQGGIMNMQVKNYNTGNI